MRTTLIVLALGALPVAAPAQTPDAAAGAEIFQTHCAMCHGAKAEGDGPLAASLTLRPKNLTQLAAENGGVFPLMDAVRKIDGTDPLVSHGSPMPVFGPYFAGDRGVAMKTASGQPVMMSQPVADVIAWLLTVQK